MTSAVATQPQSMGEAAKDQVKHVLNMVRKNTRTLITTIGAAVLVACLLFGGVAGFNAAMIAVLSVAGGFILAIKLAKYAPRAYNALFGGQAAGLKRMGLDAMAFGVTLLVAGSTVTGLVAAGIATLLTSVALEWLPEDASSMLAEQD